MRFGASVRRHRSAPGGIRRELAGGAGASTEPAAPAQLPDRGKTCVLAEAIEAGQGPWHSHVEAQLIHPGDAVITVNTPDGLWVVPPARAAWILGGVKHQISSRRPCTVNVLYVAVPAANLPTRSCVVAIEPLIEKLLVAAAATGSSIQPGSPEERLIEVILDRVPREALAPLLLASPSDERLLRITAVITAEPADGRTLDELAAEAGLTARTAARLFLRDTGLTFGEWRQQARLFAALELLRVGASVTAVALDVGYHDVSSFIHVFKATFGTTPARYFEP